MSASANINTHTTLMINLYIGAFWLPHRSQEWLIQMPLEKGGGKKVITVWFNNLSVLPGVKYIWTKWFSGQV